VAIYFYQHHLLKSLFSNVSFGHLCQNNILYIIYLYISHLVVYIIFGSSVLLVFVLVFVQVLCDFCYYSSVVKFEVRYCDTSNITLFA
jgi:hypothetical protein